MSLTRQDVEKIAHLARLSITEQEMPVYVTSLSSIVEFRRRVVARRDRAACCPWRIRSTASISACAPTWCRRATITRNTRRNAPAVQAGLYVVPRVIE